MTIDSALKSIDSALLPVNEFAKQLDDALAQVATVVLGKPQTIRLALTCLLAGGHLIIEDLPGMGKTTLAQALAVTMGLQYQRIQFTSDLLPADILGASVYERQSGTFVFHSGPIFSQLILADEINRATPKTQSALLECMEEQQVTTDGETRSLPTPFFVIATQNPDDQIGTFALPESQLDRFLMRLTLGFPDARAERELLQGEERRHLLRHLSACMDTTALVALQQQVEQIHISPPLLDYLQTLLQASRSNGVFRHGLSPRAGLGLLRAARAWALLEYRDYVIPEDIQTVLPAVVSHRLQLRNVADGDNNEQLFADFLQSVPVTT